MIAVSDRLRPIVVCSAVALFLTALFGSMALLRFVDPDEGA